MPVHSRLPAGSSTAPPGAGTGTAAETALIILAQSGLLVSWTEAAELQRASLALCEACRRCVPVRVRVGTSTPRAVWARRNDGGGGGGGGDRSRSGGAGAGGRGSPDDKGNKGKRRRRQQQQTGGGGGGGPSPRVPRLPRLQISSLVWEAAASHLGDGSGLPSALRELTFGRDFNRPLSGIQWPRELERLTFGSRFNRELVRRKDGSGDRQVRTAAAAAAAAAAGAAGGVGGVVRREESGKSPPPPGGCLLPESLKELTFGKQFNKPLPKALLPPGLVSLTLGRNFRQRGSVRDAVWPSGLKVRRRFAQQQQCFLSFYSFCSSEVFLLLVQPSRAHKIHLNIISLGFKRQI